MTAIENKEQGQLLSRKDIDKAAWSYIFFSQATQSFERTMGLAFCHAVEPILKKLYKNDDEEHKRALKRHMQFYNTEPQLGTLILGIIIAMEEAWASGGEVSEGLIVNTENALMGLFAGIGDPTSIGTLSPILLSIVTSTRINDDNLVGPIFFCVTWLVPMVALQRFLFRKGYSMGIDAANTLFKNKALTNKITTGLIMMGLIVIGGAASMTVKVGVIYKFVSGDMSISIQEQIPDKVMPVLFSLAATLVVWYLMDKKKWNTNKIILAIVVFATVIVAPGII